MEVEPANKPSETQPKNNTETKETKKDEPKEIPDDDEQLLMMKELIAQLRNMAPLDSHWVNYARKRRKRFQECAGRLVSLVTEEYLRMKGEMEFARTHVMHEFMCMELREPEFFDQLKQFKCVAALMSDGSVMLSTEDGKYFWEGGVSPEPTSKQEHKFVRYIGSETQSTQTTEDFNAAMRENQVCMLAHDTEFDDVLVRYRHILGGLRWEDMNPQMENFEKRRGVKPPLPEIPQAPAQASARTQPAKMDITSAEKSDQQKSTATQQITGAAAGGSGIQRTTATLHAHAHTYPGGRVPSAGGAISAPIQSGIASAAGKSAAQVQAQVQGVGLVPGSVVGSTPDGGVGGVNPPLTQQGSVGIGEDTGQGSGMVDKALRR